MTRQTLHLKTAIGNYGHHDPIKDGSIQPDGVELEQIEVAPLTDAFRRMCRTLEFDVCEMPLFSYLPAKQYGLGFTAIPIFPLTRFHHGDITGNTNAGVNEPKDLEGKRVGIRGYTLTPGTWPRVVLATEYGVDLSKITWVSSEGEHVEQYQKDAPKNVSYEIGADLAKLLREGNLAGGIVLPPDAPHLKQLVPDATNAAIAAARRTAMTTDRTIVIRDSILAENPWLAPALYEAFKAAHDQYVNGSKRGEIGGYPIATDGFPLIGCGVPGNRKTLELVAQVAFDQQLTKRRFAVEELFAANTLQLP